MSSDPPELLEQVADSPHISYPGALRRTVCALRAVLDLHYAAPVCACHGDETVCSECDEPAPCPTVHAITRELEKP